MIGLRSKILANLKWRDLCMKGSIRHPFWYVSTYIKSKKVQQVNGYASIESLVLMPLYNKGETVSLKIQTPDFSMVRCQLLCVLHLLV